MASRSVNANPVATTSIDLNTPKLGFGWHALATQ